LLKGYKVQRWESSKVNLELFIMKLFDKSIFFVLFYFTTQNLNLKRTYKTKNMSLEIIIPNVAESITEVTIAGWLKADGETIHKDEPICEIETDKASQELFAEATGVLKILAQAGDTVAVGATIGKIETNGVPTAEAKPVLETETKMESATSQSVVVDETKTTDSQTSGTQTSGIKTGDIIEMRVPAMAESITEVVIGAWFKDEGDLVNIDEAICEVETDKATQELTAESSGYLHIIAQEGATLKVGELICKIAVAQVSASSQSVENKATNVENKSVVGQNTNYATGTPSPSASKILSEKGVDPKDVEGTGKDGRVTKGDALNAQKQDKPVVQENKVQQSVTPVSKEGSREQRREKMSAIRRTIARRLVAVKNETAMLTTFNEVNMKPIMDLRAKYKDEFKEKHQVGLGFMSFFARAAVKALQTFPAVNAMIDGNEIIYNDFVDISVAVSTEKGLVVPILRNVETMNFAGIEKGIVALAVKAKDNKLSIEEMSGGTFTITNGAILGMHNIVERPMAVKGEVVILPMMYLALSYDHRIIDGKEAVSFLVTVKKYLEEPERLLFDI
jgi:2-oxoglutarate dehydrogenase E2 component (dihydrolipoamide succinyltransferase)